MMSSINYTLFLFLRMGSMVIAGAGVHLQVSTCVFCLNTAPQKKTGLDQQTKIGWNCTRLASNLIRHTKACHDLEDDCRNLWVMWHHHLQVTQQTSVKTLYNASVRIDSETWLCTFRFQACGMPYQLQPFHPRTHIHVQIQQSDELNFQHGQQKQQTATCHIHCIYNHMGK